MNCLDDFIRLSDNAIEAALEPLDGLVALDAVRSTDLALHAAAASDTLTRAGHAAVEVHAVDTDGRVVLDTKIDVLADTEAEVAGLGEVALAQLVLLDLEATLKNLLSLVIRVSRTALYKLVNFFCSCNYLGATDGDVDSNLFVTTDTEGSDGVTGLACDEIWLILLLFDLVMIGFFCDIL
jgi:hypothetical protein